MPGASVRLYWRGPRDPNLNEVSWRLASQGTTDDQGRARLASLPPTRGAAPPASRLKVNSRNGGLIGEVLGVRPGERSVGDSAPPPPKMEPYRGPPGTPRGPLVPVP
jgi:hypothetical protein